MSGATQEQERTARSSLDRAADWIATGAAAGSVFAALVAFDLLQRAALPFGSDRHQHVVSSMSRAINRAASIAGTRFRVVGRENVAEGQNYILVANHQSLLDITMTSDFLEPLAPRYVSKRELARGIPGVSFNLTRGGSALIDRKDPAQAHSELARFARLLVQNRWSVMIFPEGTRSKTGAMKPFREAGLRTLIEHAKGVPVLPVTTSGGSRLFAHDLKPVVRNVELVYRIHPPTSPPDPADAAAFTEFVKSLERTIEAGLEPEDRAAGVRAKT